MFIIRRTAPTIKITIVEQSSIAVVTEIAQDMEEAATLDTFFVVEIQEQDLDT